MRRKRPAWIPGGLAFVLGTMLAGCAPFGQQPSDSTESLLSQAGFEALGAQTPEQSEQLRWLDQQILVRHRTAAGARFVYADEAGCDCLYVGDQRAYERYRKLFVARDKPMLAEANALPGSLDWAAWQPAPTDP